ncbi:MAG: hypothetical protein ACYDC1_21810 [Limisphaerales bacterium]
MNRIRLIGFGLLVAFWLPTLVLAGPAHSRDGTSCEASQSSQATLSQFDAVLSSPYLPSPITVARPPLLVLQGFGATHGLTSSAPACLDPAFLEPARSLQGARLMAWHFEMRAVAHPRAPSGRPQ